MAKNIKVNKREILNSPAIITKRETTSYLNTEVKEYALYVIQTRAVPNIMDGLRIGARKIIHSAMTGTLKHGKKEKMPALIGDTMKNEFHHGDASLKNTIEQLGAKHLFEYAPLDLIGQTGTLRVPDVNTAARYLSLKVNDNMKMFKHDLDILNYNFEDGKYTEPRFFLPIIPIVLLWRTNSPGFGFSFRSFSHDINDIIDACLTSVINGSCNTLHYIPIKPKIYGIKDENIIYNESKNSWYNVGEYRIDNMESDSIVITDLPYNVSYRKYSEHLMKLKEENYIFDFINMSTKGNIKYVVTFAKGRLEKHYSEKWKFFTKMKLFVKIPNLTLNTIDIDGKSIVKFESTQELIDGFVRRRLIYYRQRKTKLVETIEKTIIELSDKAKFIQLVVDEKLVVFKRKLEDVKKDCDAFGVTYEGLKLPTIKYTEEEIIKALNEIENLKAELEYIKNTTIEQMYINDLVKLKEEVSEINQII